MNVIFPEEEVSRPVVRRRGQAANHTVVNVPADDLDSDTDSGIRYSCFVLS